MIILDTIIAKPQSEALQRKSFIGTCCQYGAYSEAHQIIEADCCTLRVRHGCNFGVAGIAI